MNCFIVSWKSKAQAYKNECPLGSNVTLIFSIHQTLFYRGATILNFANERTWESIMRLFRAFRNRDCRMEPLLLWRVSYKSTVGLLLLRWPRYFVVFCTFVT